MSKEIPIIERKQTTICSECGRPLPRERREKVVEDRSYYENVWYTPDEWGSNHDYFC